MQLNKFVIYREGGSFISKSLKTTSMIFILVMTIIGCIPEQSYTFEGESEHWRGVMRTPMNGDQLAKLKLIYKQDLEKLANIDELIYSYEWGNNSGETTLHFKERSSVGKQYTVVTSKKSSEIEADDVIEVKVRWDGKEESFSMKSQ